MAAATIVLNLAYVCLLASTFTRTIVTLRSALIAGSVAFITFGLWVDIPSMVAWNSVTGTLHTVQLVKAVRARRAIALTKDDESVRQTLFPELDAFDFHALWSMGEEKRPENVQLTHSGQPQHWVGLLLDGHVEVWRKGSPTARLDAGALIGEMSFMGGGHASADCYAIGPVRLRVWGQEQLAMLDELNPTSSRALLRLIGRDLTTKVG